VVGLKCVHHYEQLFTFILQNQVLNVNHECSNTKYYSNNVSKELYYKHGLKILILIATVTNFHDCTYTNLESLKK
jgi:hypothetical protein